MDLNEKKNPIEAFSNFTLSKDLEVIEISLVSKISLVPTKVTATCAV